jgi:hypothetical protein
MDDSPRDPSHATTSELADAIDEMLSGVGVTIPRTDSIGCSVKWNDVGARAGTGMGYGDMK